MITPMELDELEAALEGVTKGPWIRSGIRNKLGEHNCFMVGQDGFLIVAVPIGRDHAEAFRDAGYISKVDPGTVKRLIDAARLGIEGIARCP